MKKLLMLVTLLVTSLCVNAQVIGNKWSDNIYVGVSGGATTPLELKDVFPINPVAGVHIGKNVTPVLGFEVEGIALFGKYNYNQSVSQWMSTTAVKGFNVSLSSKFNLMNAIKGYKGKPRTFEVYTVTGVGLLHYFSNHSNANNYISAKTGLDLALNVSDAVQLYVEPVILWNLSYNKPIEFNKHNAQLGLQVGFNYKFMTSNGTHNFVYPRLYDQNEVDVLNAKIAQLKKELAQKPTREVKVVEKIITTTTPEMVNVYFAFDSAELTQTAKEELNKIQPNSTVTVTGYASNEGTPKYNAGLSLRRAKAVAEYLTSRGVYVKFTEGKGIASHEFNRVVVVK